MAKKIKIPGLSEKLDAKTVSELSEKHFSRYGEFLVSFELSKHGWNVYTPVYDEYIDILIHKYYCKVCKKLWNHTPELICKQCGKDFTKTQKNKIQTGVCKDCGEAQTGNKSKCSKCGKTNILRRPSCDKCHGEIEMKKHKCECGSTKYETKFRTIQVKSSRIEDNKNSYAIDMKPKDLIEDGLHFYIWCLIDNDDRPHFLVMTVKNFVETMGKSLQGISFFKDQDRQHFNATDFGKWGKYINRFDKLE
ncbi:MAG: hypothetical protein HY738_16275 [Bacteroidia bacterium]|nr:hypothetical protein [Bacteroidia bacterium]